MTDEKDPEDRRADGTFARGVSGNPGGRPKKTKQTMHPEQLRDMAFDVGEHSVWLTIEGRRRRVSLYVANLTALGIAGARGDVKAAQDFIREMRLTSQNEQAYMNAQIENLRGVIPPWMNVKDPEEREAARKWWLAEVAIAQGTRPRRTSGKLGQRRKRRR